MFDIVIVGAGPAGITAGIYAKRAGKNVLVIERAIIGGQVASIGEIENYPGFSKVEGYVLADAFRKQAKSLGVEFVSDVMTDFKVQKNKKIVVGKKQNYEAKVVIFAMGANSKELDVEGEKDFLGKGVSYCATCDGNFFKNKDVVVVGSGESAVASALYLLPICKSVSIISKNPELKLKSYPKTILEKLKNVQLYFNSHVTKINGDQFVQSVEIDRQNEPIKADGVFVAIGRTPDTLMLKGKVDLDEKGYIKTDEHMRTSLEGVFACGDVSNIDVKQIVTATATGAIAATEAIKLLSRN